MKNKEIKDELNELGSFLSKIDKDKKEGFSLPKNYFDTFEERLMSRIQEEEALQPKTSLDNSTTNLPQNGFWDFLKNLMRPQYTIGFSTCLILIVMAWFYMDNTLPVTNSEPMLLAEIMEQELSIEETNAYVINNIEEFETEDILASLETEEVDDLLPNLNTSSEELNPVEEPLVTNEKSNMDKALEKAGGEGLLDDLTVEDLEEEEDLF